MVAGSSQHLEQWAGKGFSAAVTHGTSDGALIHRVSQRMCAADRHESSQAKYMQGFGVGTAQSPGLQLRALVCSLEPWPEGWSPGL